jgi:hypothetical protein
MNTATHIIPEGYPNIYTRIGIVSSRIPEGRARALPIKLFSDIIRCVSSLTESIDEFLSRTCVVLTDNISDFYIQQCHISIAKE